MDALKRLQRKVQNAILRREVISDVHGAIDVYHTDYPLRFIRVLSKDFKKTLRYCGKDLFEQLVTEYAAAALSRQTSLSQIGEGLSSFILTARSLSKWAPHQIRACSELSRLEWRQVVAQKKICLVIETKEMDPLRSLIFLAPTTWGGRFDFRVHQKMDRQNIDEVAPTRIVVFVDPQGRTRVRSLTKRQYRWLGKLGTAKSPIQLLELCANKTEVFWLSAQLKTWISLGIVLVQS